MSKGYTVEKRETEGVKLLILRPTVNAKERAKTPGILWIHGGMSPAWQVWSLYQER